MKSPRVGPTFPLLALIFLSLSPLAGQNITSVSFESRDLREQETMRGQMHFLDEALRIDGAAGSQAGHFSMIFRADKNLLWFLEHDKRQYIEMTQQTMEQMSKQISDMLAQMQQQLEKLPTEQREAMTRLLKDRLPETDPEPAPPPDIRATSESREISGYSCSRFDVFKDGEKVAEVWATSRSSIPGAANLNHVFESLAEFYRSLTAGVAQFQTGFNFNVLAELDGFPIQISNYEEGELLNEMLIKEVHSGSASADLFERPSDYKEEKMGFPR